MKRTKLRDRDLPDYTKGEEVFNMTSHIVGGAIGVAALVLCVVRAALHGNAWGVVGGAIFGVSMIALYTMSSVYHGLRPGTGKRVLQVIDHCTIYFLIAGTYTPLLLSAMRPIDPVSSWVLFGVVWSLTILATVLTAIDLRRYRVFSMICYIAIGWAIIFKAPLLLWAIGRAVCPTPWARSSTAWGRSAAICTASFTCSWWRAAFCTCWPSCSTRCDGLQGVTQ